MQEPDLQAFKLWNILGFKLPELLSEGSESPRKLPKLESL